ncbi:unnamed protein product [Rotaria sp. Silwood1]|nr:unnamed protein product [Rotaria sp. Silwood1]CAF3507054.1 unnamed protein product [Rotaria sp. Silwood1]CAF3572651.1 unnamed protein product [Rotaria sp. Silwood1]CAF4642377.1 unnamed protein product [Rotaria sp. Silwood1]CAF4656016.1 unnamed protein product [Rotaria sp. Silwood1]
MYRPRPPIRPLPPPAAAAGAGALGGVLGGLGGAVTCICCLAAIGLLGLWATFIPFVAFFKYAWDQETRAFGSGPSLQNFQQIVILLAICLLTIRFMSSSQEQSKNSSNEQPQNTNPTPSAPIDPLYSDYEEYPPINQNYSENSSNQSSLMHGGPHYDSAGQIDPNEQYENIGNDDDIPDELENELEATVERMTSEQLTDNDEDEPIYAEDVQNAFARYENEQDEMFEQMRECMLFMEQEYSTAEMPSKLIEISQTTNLNPDAAEFRPANSQAAVATDKERIVVVSWVPCEAKKQNE